MKKIFLLLILAVSSLSIKATELVIVDDLKNLVDMNKQETILNGNKYPRHIIVQESVKMGKEILSTIYLEGETYFFVTYHAPPYISFKKSLEMLFVI